MSALRSALLEWDADRIGRILVAAVGVFLAIRLTDGFLTGLVAAVVLAGVLDAVLRIAGRIAERSTGE